MVVGGTHMHHPTLAPRQRTGGLGGSSGAVAVFAVTPAAAGDDGVMTAWAAAVAVGMGEMGGGRLLQRLLLLPCPVAATVGGGSPRVVVGGVGGCRPQHRRKQLQHT